MLMQLSTTYMRFVPAVGQRPDPDRQARIELYRRRVELGREPCTGRRPRAPDRGRPTAWLAGELEALEAWLAEERARREAEHDRAVR